MLGRTNQSSWIHSIKWFLLGWIFIFIFTMGLFGCGPTSPSIDKTEALQQQYKYEYCGLAQKTGSGGCLVRLSNSPVTLCLSTQLQRINDYFLALELNETKNLCTYGNQAPFQSIEGLEFRVEEFVEI